MHVAGEVTTNLDFHDLRVNAASSMMVRYSRVECQVSSEVALVSQFLQLTCALDTAVTALLIGVGLNAGTPQSTSVFCPSLDVFCYCNGLRACKMASDETCTHLGSSQVNHSYESSRGMHTFAYTTDMLSPLINQQELGADGFITPDNELLKVLPFDIAVSNVAAIITIEVYHNPGKYTCMHIHVMNMLLS